MDNEFKDKIKEDLNGLTPGSEEYLNQAKAYAAITTAEADEKKADIEEKIKKVEKWTLIGGCAASFLVAIAKLLEPILRRESNKDWVRAEDQGFYVRHQDNK